LLLVNRRNVIIFRATDLLIYTMPTIYNMARYSCFRVEKKLMKKIGLYSNQMLLRIIWHA